MVLLIVAGIGLLALLLVALRRLRSGKHAERREREAARQASLAQARLELLDRELSAKDSSS